MTNQTIYGTVKEVSDGKAIQTRDALIEKTIYSVTELTEAYKLGIKNNNDFKISINNLKIFVNNESQNSVGVIDIGIQRVVGVAITNSLTGFQAVPNTMLNDVGSTTATITPTITKRIYVGSNNTNQIDTLSPILILPNQVIYIQFTPDANVDEFSFIFSLRIQFSLLNLFT